MSKLNTRRRELLIRPSVHLSLSQSLYRFLIFQSDSWLPLQKLAGGHLRYSFSATLFVSLLSFLYWLDGTVKSALNPISEWQTEAARAPFWTCHQTFNCLAMVLEKHIRIGVWWYGSVKVAWCAPTFHQYSQLRAIPKIQDNTNTHMRTNTHLRLLALRWARDLTMKMSLWETNHAA